MEWWFMSDISEIYVFGVSGTALVPDHEQLLRTCHAVVTSKRFSSLVTKYCDTVIPVTPLKKMVGQLRAALSSGNVAVLASGDPLFYGIGRTLLNNFASEQLRFYPALSAMQLACARFKMPWDDLFLLSLHGRQPGDAVAQILSRQRVMLFTDGNNSPDIIAATLQSRLNSMGLAGQAGDIRVGVAENLGLPDEQLTRGTLADIAARKFAPLNMMLVEQPAVVGKGSGLVFGLHEDEISHSRGLITKAEVRAVILHCLRLPGRGVFWDVGGGSGSVSVEAARLCADLQVFTVEQKLEGQENISKNICDFRLYNMQLVRGRAPEALVELPDPDRIFIGGSGGALASIIKDCAERLQAGGRMVASAVLAETAEKAPELMRSQGLHVEVCRVAVTRYHPQPSQKPAWLDHNRQPQQALKVGRCGMARSQVLQLSDKPAWLDHIRQPQQALKVGHCGMARSQEQRLSEKQRLNPITIITGKK